MALVPKKLYIMQRLSAILETAVQPGTTDITFEGKVWRGRTVLGRETAFPCYSLLESPKPDPNPQEGGHNGMTKLTQWPILLQGFTSDDKENPLDPAYYLEAVAEQTLSRINALGSNGKPLFPDDYLLPHNGASLISKFIIMPSVARPPDANVSATAFTYIPLIVEMSFSPLNPYVEVT